MPPRFPLFCAIEDRSPSNLGGTQPAILFYVWTNVEHLQMLAAYAGSIPNELGNLTQSSGLNLGGNKLTGKGGNRSPVFSMFSDGEADFVNLRCTGLESLINLTPLMLNSDLVA